MPRNGEKTEVNIRCCNGKSITFGFQSDFTGQQIFNLCKDKFEIESDSHFGIQLPSVDIQTQTSDYGNIQSSLILRILMAMTLEYYAWSHRHAVKKSQLLLAMNNFEFGIVSNHLRRQKLLKLHKLPLLLPLTFAKHSNGFRYKYSGSREPF